MTLEGHDALVLWTQLAVLLIAARMLGRVAQRLDQPPVVGSLLAGLLLGPSVFGQVWPAGFHWFLPADGDEPRLLFAIASVSLLILLIVLGAEADLPLIRSLGTAAAAVSAGSIVLPLAVGLAAGYLVPDALVGEGARRTSFAVLLAAGLSVSSLPVVARIVSELGMERRNFAQLGVAAATANDAYGFLALAVGAALAGEGSGLGRLVLPFAGLVGLVAVLAWIGQPAVDGMLRVVRKQGPNVAGSLAVSFTATFAVAAAAQALGIDAAFGAFLAGVVLGRSRFQQSQSMEVLEDTTTAVFAPLYFATAGLQVDLTTLGDAAVAWSFVALLVVSAVAKYAGSALGAVAARLTFREASALGIALNGRGAMQVIISSAALAFGVFDTAAFTVVVLVAIVTSVGVPPLLRATVKGWRGSEEEQERLEREERLEANVVVRGQRLLLPSRGSLNSFTAAQVLDCAWPESSELTVLSIGTEAGDEPDVSPILELPSGRPVRHQHVTEGHVLEEILEEANLGYGVMAVGAVEQPSHERLLPQVIEELLNYSPIPMLVVRRGRVESGAGLPIPRHFRNILVPVAGSAASRAGQEVAHSISLQTGADVRLLHVLTRPETRPQRGRLLRARVAPPAGSAGSAGSAAEGAVTAVLVDAQAVAEEHGVAAVTELRRGSFAGEEVAEAVRDSGADVVVVGATVRRVGGRPFLGHTVEHVLEHVFDATVVVVVLPEVAVTKTGEGHADRSSR